MMNMLTNYIVISDSKSLLCYKVFYYNSNIGLVQGTVLI